MCGDVDLREVLDERGCGPPCGRVLSRRKCSLAGGWVIVVTRGLHWERWGVKGRVEGGDGYCRSGMGRGSGGAGGRLLTDALVKLTEGRISVGDLSTGPIPSPPLIRAGEYPPRDPGSFHPQGSGDNEGS
eukprot:757389-Hanusia_phi.AAC.3